MPCTQAAVDRGTRLLAEFSTALTIRLHGRLPEPGVVIRWVLRLVTEFWSDIIFFSLFGVKNGGLIHIYTPKRLIRL